MKFVGSPSRWGLQKLGQRWSAPLIRSLEQAAEREPDPERKGWLRKTAAYLGSAGRDLAVEIGATAINRQMGM